MHRNATRDGISQLVRLQVLLRNLEREMLGVRFWGCWVVIRAIMAVINARLSSLDGGHRVPRGFWLHQPVLPKLSEKATCNLCHLDSHDMWGRYLSRQISSFTFPFYI